MSIEDNWIELIGKKKKSKVCICSIEALEEQANKFTTLHLKGGSQIDVDQTISDIWRQIKEKRQHKQLRYKRGQRE